jgi:hypothetical protein
MGRPVAGPPVISRAMCAYQAAACQTAGIIQLQPWPVQIGEENARGTPRSDVAAVAD